MKFAEHLTAHITPEWRKQYINYEEMKALLYQAIEEAPSLETTEQEVIARYFKMFDENFFVYCDKELKKINLFYSGHICAATAALVLIKGAIYHYVMKFKRLQVKAYATKDTTSVDSTSPSQPK
ncbi:hypothetical protein WDU94_003544 [Cyamophila willieti]